MRARLGLAAALAGLLTAPAAFAEPPPASGRPNVLLVLVDTLRFDHLGFHGYARPTSPFLDGLAATGSVFEDAWAQAPETQTSTATLFTSRFHPVMPRAGGGAAAARAAAARRAMQRRLADENETLAERLRHRGYETLGVFTNPFHHPESGFQQGFDRAIFAAPRSAAEGRRRVAADGALVNEAFGRLLAKRDPGRPVFAYLHYMDVHSPYAPPPALARAFAGPPRRFRFDERVPNGRLRRPPKPWELARLRALYDAEVRYVDDLLRELVERLESDADPRTWVIVVSSDHGEEFMEHGGLGHGKTLEAEMLRVPLLVHGVPGQRPGRVGATVRNLDLMPTLLDITGAPIPAGLEGRSLLPYIRGGRPEEAAAPPSLARQQRTGLQSITTSRWHFVRNGVGGRLLYDRRTDPGGFENRVAEHPDVTRELRVPLDAAVADLHDVQRRERAIESAGDVPLPGAEVIDQLEALGYVDRNDEE